MITRIWPALLLLGGCASLDDVMGGIANTPDWFQERRVEIRGDGYPSLRNVPVAPAIAEPEARMELSAAEAEAARAFMNDHARSEQSPYTHDELLEMMSPMRAQLPIMQPKPEGFVSQEEIEALQDQLTLPPRG